MPKSPPPIIPLDWRISPEEAFARWRLPTLVALLSADRSAASRWSILAAPTQVLQADIHRRLIWHAPTPAPPMPHGLAAAHPLDALDALVAASRCWTTTELPFVGGWIGVLSYDMGRFIEPSAQHHGRDRARFDARPWPIDDFPVMEFHRCDGALVHDARDGRWFAVGREGGALAATALEDRPLWGRRRPLAPGPASATGRERYVQMVGRAIELIRAGDVFQVNLAHHLRTPLVCAGRDIMLAMLRSASPAFGAYVESQSLCDGSPLEVGDEQTLRWATCSISPELFLDVDFDTGRVVTRPIKGTRLVAPGLGDELHASEKDRAELAMIVDLMRNDLGRVCEYGSIRVTDPRSIDTHGPGEGALHHASATIEGRLRPRTTIGELLRATFPPGSVTGAPKIRAMQIIDEIEDLRRDAYCGAIGYISDHGQAAFNVAIRTATFHSSGTWWGAEGTLTYPIGAGIVADSDPESEWHETMAKAAMFLRAIGQTGAAPA